MFMMSSGGLTAAELFRGKDAILSGPAAGVVGMAETGRAAGFTRLIGFDMGGTSTDVSHFAGAVRARVRDRSRRRAHARADDADPYGGGRRRLDPAFRRRAVSRRPGFGRRQSRPEMLSPRRPAGGDRRQCDGRQAHCGFLSEDFRPATEPAARCRCGAPGLCGVGERDRRRPQQRTSRRRLHQDRRREHGQRDQEDFGAARLRRDALCAQLLRRRRRPARLPGGRCARHGERADPSAVVAAVGLRHGACRYPQRPPAGHRGAVRRQGAQDARRRGAAAGARDHRRSRRPRRRGEQDHSACARAYPLRRNRYAADRRCRQE